LILQGNTLADPKFKEGDSLKTFDYVIANPPFSDKRWSTGIDPLNDPHERFKHFGTLPAKQSDYAYLLRIAIILSDMDAEIAALETKLAKYRQIKRVAG
jgi:type I restriction enzyme M protein